MVVCSRIVVKGALRVVVRVNVSVRRAAKKETRAKCSCVDILLCQCCAEEGQDSCLVNKLGCKTGLGCCGSNPSHYTGRHPSPLSLVVEENEDEDQANDEALQRNIQHRASLDPWKTELLLENQLVWMSCRFVNLWIEGVLMRLPVTDLYVTSTLKNI
ncbi:hypothetical protein MAR_007907 [Mya arenaria]|uniref:Uncharacterized protein n=1 Tax=Mya arenaria TaxID=6604 RepID=A0ABY7DWS1_MYAAR|nr:hypothetical protein MAR_007907 [Mya arenaria]